jgi:hypothetical protein
MTIALPIHDSYWLLEGQLLAGEYPGAPLHVEVSLNLDLFLSAGIRTFIDLTQPAEPVTPYSDLLSELASGRGMECRYHRIGFPDHGTPTPKIMSEILRTIRRELTAHRPVYFHCWGGVGRTGTVAACWLVEQGLSTEDALERVSALRFGPRRLWRRSPETDEQREFVRSWSGNR